MSDRLENESLRGQSTNDIDREILLEPKRKELARKAGVTEASAAIVEADVRNGKLYVTVAGKKNHQETAHRLPDEVTVRRCLDCGDGYGSSVRVCPNCGSEDTEFDVRSVDTDIDRFKGDGS